MDAQPIPLSPEDLLQHAGWMRALARRLVGEEGAADDLVQETWLAALEHPLRDGGALRPWLTRTLRNAARMRHRGAAARAARESGAARDEALEGPLEQAQCLEGQRILAELVSGLDEPYRGTVWQRYYKGLATAEIARREGVPASSIRRRLSVAHERLREGLDRRYDGDRTAWCSALLPLVASDAVKAGVTAGTATLLLGSLTMKAIAIAAVAAVSLLLGLRLLTHDPDERQRASVATLPAPVEELEALAAAPDSPDPTRRAPERAQPGRADAVAPAPSAAVQDGAAGTTLTGRVEDGEGRPLEGARAFMVAGSHHEATSGHDGVFAIELGSEAREGQTSVHVFADGFVIQALEVEVVAGQDADLGVLTLARGASVSGWVLDERGLPVQGARVVVAKKRTGELLLEHRIGPASRLSGPLGNVTDGRGEFTLEWFEPGHYQVVAKAEGYLRSYSDPFEAATDGLHDGVELRLERTPPELVIAGLVLDGNGDPAGGVQLTLMREQEFHDSRSRTTTELDGRFRFETLDPGPFDLLAEDMDSGQQASLRAVHPGQVGIELRLAPSPRVEVVVRDADGLPIGDVSVTVWTSFDLADGSRSSGGTELSPGEGPGRCSFPMPLHPFLLAVGAPGHRVAEVGPFERGFIDAPIEVVLHPRGVIRGRVFADGEPLADAEVVLRGVTGPDVYSSYNGFPLERVEPHGCDPVRTDAEGAFELRVDLDEHVGGTHGTSLFVVQARAAGLAPTESGPFGAGGPGGELSLHLAEGGAIEGRVIGAPDVRLVAASMGDLEIVSDRVAEDGSYRLEHLRPGRWRVRPYSDRFLRSRGIITGSADRRPERTWDCVVSEGATTHHDLDLASERSLLRGRLEDPDAGRWTAVMRAHGADDWLTRSFYAPAEVGAGGDFELLAAQRGVHTLLLTRLAADGTLDARISDRLDLAISEEAWSHTLHSAPLEGQVEDPALLDGGVILHVSNPVGERWVLTRVRPGEDGGFSARVPVGQGALRFYQDDEHGRESLVPERGRELVQVQVPEAGLFGQAVR